MLRFQASLTFRGGMPWLWDWIGYNHKRMGLGKEHLMVLITLQNVAIFQDQIQTPILHETSLGICAALDDNGECDDDNDSGCLVRDVTGHLCRPRKLSKTRWLPRLRHLLCLWRVCNETILECNQCENTSNPRHAGYLVFLQQLYRSMTFCKDTFMLPMVKHGYFTNLLMSRYRGTLHCADVICMF